MIKKAFCLLVMSVVFLSACQPTPEKPAVIEKKDLEQKILQTATSVFSAEERWEESLNEDGVQVTIDAVVEIPDVLTINAIDGSVIDRGVGY